MKASGLQRCVKTLKCSHLTDKQAQNWLQDGDICLAVFEYMKELVIGKSSQEDPSGLLCFNTQNNLQDLKSSKFFSVMSLSLCPLASGDDCGIQAVPEA